MDVLEALKTRRSIRQYQTKPVPREVLDDIVDCARLSPTANNKQPWSFVVVTDAAVRQRVADFTEYGKFIAIAPALVVVFCEDCKYYMEDGAAATMAVLLAAHGHGLGTCWVAGDKKPYAAELNRLLGVPPTVKLISLIPVGYPAAVPKPSKRPLADVLHRERYGQH